MSRNRDTSRLSSAIQVVGANNDVLPQVDDNADLGSSSFRWVEVYGESTSALYADLAERYEADDTYEPGTVLVIGGEKEVTTTTTVADMRVAGVVSTEPAVKMNDGPDKKEWPFIALAGRVPCRVVGTVRKGDHLVTSSTPGAATSATAVSMAPAALSGAVIGVAMEDNDQGNKNLIEVLVKSG